jgi:hypothetical protein
LRIRLSRNIVLLNNISIPLFIYQAQKRIKSFSNLFLKKNKKKQSFSDPIITLLYTVAWKLNKANHFFDLHLNCRLFRDGRFHKTRRLHVWSWPKVDD